jgi:pilus assembly protein CpaC
MIRALLLLCVALCPALAGAQTAAGRVISLIAGRGELLSFDRDVTKVVIAEPKIADAVVVSPREVMVSAKAFGKTTLMIWETGSAPRRFDIDVLQDRTTEALFASELEAELKRALPEADVTFSGNPLNIVLTGSVKDPEWARKAEALAATRSQKVVNLIRVPSPVSPKQIMLQVKFASVDRVGLEELGFNWFSRNPQLLGALSTQQFQAPRFSQLQFQNNEFANSTLNIADLLNIFLYRPDLNIGATIKALQQRNLLQILAEPNLITTEGKEANFIAGGEFPFPILTATTTGGATAPVVTVQFKPFGVQLGFTPEMLPDGAIRLKVKPEVSSLDYANSVNVQGVLIPAVSTRRAETEVVLRDGESFAIAGLLDNRVIQTVQNIWGLGNIPILGELFKSRSTRKTQDELLVVITPKFVKPLSPEEKAKLPETLESFLPTVSEMNAMKAEKELKKKKGKEAKQPQYAGPRGYQEPKK